MALRGALSYSASRTYLECPLRYRFLYIEGLPETPRGYFSFGRSVHSALEEFVRPLLSPQARRPAPGEAQKTLDEWHPGKQLSPPPGLLPRAELLALLDRHWVSDGYSSPEEETRYKRLGAEMLSGYYDEFQRSPPVPVAVEEHLEAQWDGIPIHGYVDRIDLTPGGGLEIVDYKTSRELSRGD
ncbi:MAG TPA: PD-(D/E)XK nuclease family protein, partial [Thermoplasmata archaeon]|nr:PD-(D/E)XK nuclease family protein [Thermoplasmata archaeon]